MEEGGCEAAGQPAILYGPNNCRISPALHGRENGPKNQAVRACMRCRYEDRPGQPPTDSEMLAVRG